MKLALKDIFLTVKKMSILKKGDTVLDIGANDGTLLKYFKKKISLLVVNQTKKFNKIS